MGGKRKEAKDNVHHVYITIKCNFLQKFSDRMFFCAFTCSSLPPFPHSYTIVQNIVTAVWPPGANL